MRRIAAQVTRTIITIRLVCKEANSLILSLKECLAYTAGKRTIEKTVLQSGEAVLVLYCSQVRQSRDCYIVLLAEEGGRP